ELARVTVFASGDDRHGSPSADQGACFVRGRSRPRSAAARSTAEARLALARLPSRLLDRGAAALERLGAQVHRLFGTAAAAARLIFRGREASRRIQEAIGLAGSYPSGVAQFYYSGSSGKRIQAAHAAQSGVAAALLTQAGFSGPVDIIEGSGGFARAYADAWDPAIIESGLG